MIIGHFVSFGIGGADRASINLIKSLKRRNINQLVFYNSNSFPRKTPDQDKTQIIQSIKEEYDLIGLDLVKIKSVGDFNKFNIDILHTQRSGEDEWLIPGLGSINRNFKIVETNFHGYLSTPADFRIFPSYTLTNFRHIDLNSCTAVIPNAIEAPSSISNIRRNLGIGSEIVIGRVGRSDKSIYTEKYFKIFREFPSNTVLLWIGKSELAKRDAARYGVKNIIWLDPTIDRTMLSKFYNTFDIYLHVNRLGETFANTVAEAMYHSLPVLSLKGKRNYPQAQYELLGDTNQYFSSAKKLTKSGLDLIENIELRKKLGLLNYLKAHSCYSFDSVADKTLKIYNQMLST